MGSLTHLSTHDPPHEWPGQPGARPSANASAVEGREAVTVLVLGPPEILLLRGPVHGLGRPERELVLFLAVRRGQDCGRDEVATELWPELSSSAASDNLRHALWRLRRGLRTGVPCLEAARRWVRMAPSVRVDWHEFQELSASDAPDDWVTALRLWRGSPLSGVYDEWAQRFARRAELEYRLVLQRAVPALSALGRHAEARYHARCLVDLDPLDEAARRVAIRAAGAAHRWRAAASQYREIERLLGEELDAVPESATTQAFLAATAGHGGRTDGSSGCHRDRDQHH